MSLYADYLNETYGKKTIETKDGFMTYSMKDKICYIEDAFVIPERRHRGIMSEMFSWVTSIARTAGCKTLMTSVVVTAQGSTASLSAYLNHFGFRLLSSSQNIIYLIKDIE